MSDTSAMPEEKSSSVLEFVKTLAYALAIALVVRTLAYEPFNIPSGSMKPTLLVGDYLFVSKFAYGYSRHSFPFSAAPFEGRVLGSTPEHGDVVVFKLPSDGRTDYIKRVVGLPGDRVQVANGVLQINGAPVGMERAAPFLDEGSGVVFEQWTETLPGGFEHEILDGDPRGFFDNTPVFEVPPGHIFAMGDNRDHSQDSRTSLVGFVPIENIVGRAEFLFFSTDGSASWWEPHKWFGAIRYDRLFDPVR